MFDLGGAVIMRRLTAESEGKRRDESAVEGT